MNKVKMVGIFLAMGLGLLVFVIGSYAMSWANRTSEIVSVQNYETQFDQLHEDWESMSKARQDWCQASEALDGAIGRNASEGVVTQRETQTLAYGQTYRRIKATYDARMANYFETLDGFVAPSELPDVAPKLGKKDCEEGAS